MGSSRREWPIWEVLGRGVDFLVVIGLITFFLALVFDSGWANFLLVLASLAGALLAGAVSIALQNH